MFYPSRNSNICYFSSGTKLRLLVNLMPIYLNKEEREKLIATWNTLATKSEKFGYKPIEATEKQRDYLNGLVKLMDSRDASILITLLQILNKREKNKTLI